MRQVHGGALAALALLLAAGGCSDDSACTGTACGSKPGPTRFESDLLGGNATRSADGGVNLSGAGGSGAAVAPTTGAKGESANDSSTSAPGEAERAISEADIIQVQGDKLFALSRVSGLAVIDVSQPRSLKLLGRYRELPATPFEMYLQDDVALVMFSGWGQYVATDDDSYQWVSTSKLLALDVADAANIKPLDSFDIPGTISDSRIVGGVLYIVGHQDGYCWSCVQNKPLTSIVSLRVADPRNVTKVDELDYEDGNSSWGPRSVSVTQDRMYVAGPEYGTDQPENSTIQVIDISDAAGDLVEGTRVKVAGQVNSRWQMDEYKGVLRVVSQPWQWWNQGPGIVMPAVQTFKVESSDKLSPLGRTDIQLPMRESLRSVRFDGTRGYAITAEQKDPLFTLDLSDPAHPRQMGELVLPGFITYMEPRGERLLGLGFDQGNVQGSIAVSLFDVKDLSAPKLLSRANFGGNWGSLPEDQDRLHKVFRVLDAAGLILVPFSGWNYGEQSKGECGGYSSYVGGVQLIDFKDDALKARGATPSKGETRRALLVKDNLLSVGDERVESFDIADRDKPQLVSQVVLSSYTTRALALDNDVVARFGMDYNKGQTKLEIVARNAAEDPNQSLAEVNLGELAAGASRACGGLEVRETFTHGSQLEVLYGSWGSRSDGSSSYLQGLLILDLSTASKPSVLSNTQWSDGGEYWSSYSGFYNYGYYGNASAIVRSAAVLSLLESSWSYDGTRSTQKTRLRVIDLRDPEHVKTSTLPLPTSETTSYAGLLADGEIVMTSHFEQTSSDGLRGRFYIDRFDLSDPAAPKRLDSINVPGALMSYDGPSGRAITSEQVRKSVSDVTAQECYERFANANWTDPRWTDGNTVKVSDAPRVISSSGSGGAAASGAAAQPIEEPKGACVGYVQRLHLVRLDAVSATLEDTYALAEREQVYSSSLGDGVLFASLGRGGYYYPAGRVVAEGACFGPCGGSVDSEPSKLLVLGGFASGKLAVGQISVDDSQQSNDWWGFWGSPAVYASGQRALLVGRSDVAVIDAGVATEPVIAKRVPLIASPQYVQLRAEEALLALGQQGVQWVDLKP